MVWALGASAAAGDPFRAKYRAGMVPEVVVVKMVVVVSRMAKVALMALANHSLVHLLEVLGKVLVLPSALVVAEFGVLVPRSRILCEQVLC